jgi:hypothetical protein
MIMLGIGALLGLRHATDPDYLTAVTTLVTSGRERAASRANELALAWGPGHAATLFAFGPTRINVAPQCPRREPHRPEQAGSPRPARA